MVEKTPNTKTKTVSRREDISLEKEIGSFYTPLDLAKHILTELEIISGSHEKINTRGLKILEPSVGDGVFLEAIKSQMDFTLQHYHD